MLREQVKAGLVNDLDMLQRCNLTERRFRLCQTDKVTAITFNRYCAEALLEPLFEIIGDAVYLSLAKTILHKYKPRVNRSMYLEVIEEYIDVTSIEETELSVKARLKTNNSVVIMDVITDGSDNHRVYAIYRNLKDRSFHLFIKDGISVLTVTNDGLVTIHDGKTERLIGRISIDELIGKYYVFKCYVASGWDFALKRITCDKTTESEQYINFVKTAMKKTLDWYNTEGEDN